MHGALLKTCRTLWQSTWLPSLQKLLSRLCRHHNSHIKLFSPQFSHTLHCCCCIYCCFACYYCINCVYWCCMRAAPRRS